MTTVRFTKQTQDSPSWFGYPGWSREHWDLWHKYGHVQAKNKALIRKVESLRKQVAYLALENEELHDTLLEATIVHEGSGRRGNQ